MPLTTDNGHIPRNISKSATGTSGPSTWSMSTTVTSWKPLSTTLSSGTNTRTLLLSRPMTQITAAPSRRACRPDTSGRLIVFNLYIPSDWRLTNAFGAFHGMSRLTRKSTPGLSSGARPLPVALRCAQYPTDGPSRTVHDAQEQVTHFGKAMISSDRE